MLSQEGLLAAALSSETAKAPRNAKLAKEFWAA